MKSYGKLFSFMLHSLANKCFSFTFFFLLKHLMRTAKTPEINFLFLSSLMSNYVEYNLNDQRKRKAKLMRISNRLIKIQRR